MLDSGQIVDIVTVYLPCFSSSTEYFAELTECLSFIEDIYADGHDVILLGDMNFECNLSNAGFRQCESVLSVYGVHHCDDFLANNRPITYSNEHLNQCSFIDHMFVSDPLRQLILNAQIIDSGANLSDHRPLVYTMQLLLTTSVPPIHRRKPAISYCWRWDKSDLNVYYDSTFHELCSVSLPATLATCDCDNDICDNYVHCAMIDTYYNDIVAAIQRASSYTVCRVPNHSLKPYWNEHLDKLKSDSIFWHNLWISAGRPPSGTIQQLRLSCKARYKLAIRDAYSNFEDKVNDDLCRHFMTKKMPEFWKTWNAKFRKNVSKQVIINGCTDDLGIANEFACHFSQLLDQMICLLSICDMPINC